MIVKVHDLWKRYGRFDALKGLEFEVPEGSAFALVGPNGAGKTTTIKILVNLLEPSRGRAAILGVDSRSISPRELADIGYVSENQELPGRLTVEEYLDYLRPFYRRWDRALEISASSRGEIERESTPRMAARPRDGSSKLTRILIVVVLPAPFGPMRANALPSGIPNSSPCSAFNRLYRFHRSRTSTITCHSPPAAWSDRHRVWPTVSRWRR